MDILITHDQKIACRPVSVVSKSVFKISYLLIMLHCLSKCEIMLSNHSQVSISADAFGTTKSFGSILMVVDIGFLVHCVLILVAEDALGGHGEPVLRAQV